MRKDFEKLFSRLGTSEMPDDLLDKIMTRIKMEKSLLAVKRKLIVFSLGFAASAIGLVPVFNLVRADFAESGFFQFFSLLFSDFSVAVNYWQTFAMSLLETVPVVSMAIFLAVILVFLWSLKLLARDLKIIYGYQ